MTPEEEATADYAALFPNDNVILLKEPPVFNSLDLFTDELPPVLPVPFNALPAALKPWADDVSQRIGCAPDYLVAGVVVGLSSLLGRKVLMRPKQKDNWLVTPNLYGAIIGRPSTKKTPAEQAALSYIEKLDRQLREENKDTVKDFRAEVKLSKYLQKDIEKTAVKLKKSGDDEAALNHIKNNDSDNIAPPPIKRAVIHNATVEKLVMLLSDNQNGLLVIRDELSGWFKTLDREENAEAREFILTAFNGNVSYSHDRVSRDAVHLPHCVLSVFGGIQPSKLKPYLMAMKNGTNDDGLLQRFQAMVYPDAFISNGKDEHPNAQAAANLELIYSYFESLPEFEEPPALNFTEEAQSLFYSWQEDNLLKARRELSPSMESHLSKLPAFVASLSLITHLADNQKLSNVDKTSLLKAIVLCEYFESHVRRIYGLVDMPDYSARSLVDNLYKLPTGFKAADFRAKHWSGLNTAIERRKALDVLVARGYLAEVKTQANNSSKTVNIYFINPDIPED